MQRDANIKHNKWNTKIYKIWISMLQRCNNPNSKGYERYGGRGIKVSDDWFDFNIFYRDMGDKPEGLSLDRKDNNAGYCKENCKWSTQKEQNNNQQRNHFITHNNKTQTLTQWAEELGINSSTLSNRINKSKWSIEKALTI